MAVRGRLRVRVLGELGLEWHGEPMRLPASLPARELLGWLAVHPAPQPRGRLAARFWPETLDTTARANLRTALWTLRRDLGAAGALLATTRDTIALTGEGLWVDVREFDALVAADRRHEALALCRGPLLADLDSEWVLDAREVHAARMAAVLDTLAAQAQAGGRTTEAAALARRRWELDMLDQAAARRLMTLLAAAGDHVAALSVYERLSERLRTDLRTAPSADTRALAERLRGDARDQRPAPPAPGGAERTEPPRPIGRDRELDVLERAWRIAAGGSGSVVLVEGEAGIGKTSMADVLAARVIGEGASVAMSGALALGRTSVPFGPWIDLVRALIGADSGATVSAALAPLVPELELEPARPGVSPDLTRAGLFAAVGALVERRAAQRPLLLVIEDVHTSDAGTLELAGVVARRAAHRPLMLVLTRRDAPPSPGVDLLLDRLRAADVTVSRLALGPLPDEDIRRLLVSVGGPAGAAATTIVEAAGGNPLLAAEAARGFRTGGSPETLVAAVRGHLADMDEDARLGGQLLALAERPLSAAELQSLPLADPASAIARLLDTGLFAERDGGFGYRHELLREAVAADIPRPRRDAVHVALAEGIEATADPRDVRRAAEVAAHLRHGGRGADAADRLRRAGELALAAGGVDEAAELLRSALDALSGDWELWLLLADVEAWAGRQAAAEQAFASALERAPVGDGVALAGAWLRKARWGQALMCSPDHVRRAVGEAVRALESFGIEDDEPWRRALGLQAWAEAVAGDPATADRLLDELQGRLAGAPRDDLTTWEIGFARGMAAVRDGRFGHAVTALVAGAQAAARAGRADLAQGCWQSAATASAGAGDREQAIELLERALVTVRHGGLRLVEARVLGALARGLAELGRSDQAAARLAEADAVASQVDDPQLAPRLAYDRGMAALAGGDHAGAERSLAAALAAGGPVSRPAARLARAAALIALDRLHEAEAEVRAFAFEPVTAADLPAALAPRLATVQAGIAAARGDAVAADRRFEEAERGWRQRARAVAVIADLGRDPLVAVIAPEEELERLRDLRAAVLG